MACSLGSAPRTAPGAQISSRRQDARSRRASLRVQAQQQGGDDLSRKFAEAARRMNVKLPEVEAQNVATQAPPRFSQSRGGWNDGPTADKVRRQEQQVLSAWTTEHGMQLAAGGTIVLVLLLLFAAGGPPSDARCTLPWC